MRLLIFFPTGTREITSHDSFYWQRFRFLYDHRASDKLLAKLLQIVRELFEIRRDEVIWNIAEPLEPKRRNLIEHCALVRDWVGQNHVKSRDAIGNDEEKCFPKIEDFAHLATAQFVDAG